MKAPPGTSPGWFAWILIGALVGGLAAVPEGALLGIFLGSGDDFLLWTGAFAGTGALLGAVVAGLGRMLAPRLMLGPPVSDPASDKEE